ncbi:MAG: DUF899 family protein [Woeseiaceae bacterium]|nr:DUF899 family protein [Woeseiaceae bacterium]
MSSFTFPNETDEYRKQRNRLLDDEVALRDHIEAVAAQRRQLPLGGKLKEDYSFERLDDDGKVETVAFDELFGAHDSLILYTMMFGREWDAPCPSCTSIVDSINVNSRGVSESAAIAAVTDATPDQVRTWAARRGWYMPVLSGTNSRYILDYAGFDTDDPGVVSAMNVFRRTPDGIFHFWAAELVSRPMANGHPRHVDMIWPMWNLLDMTPGGRGDTLVPKQDFEHRYFSKHVLGE